MTGQELKAKLATTDVSQSEIARRLDMSQPAFNQALSVADVKSGFLERICTALGVDMSFFYPMSGSNVNNIHRQSAHNISNGSGAINENKGADNSAMEILLKQNADLIALLKAEKGL